MTVSTWRGILMSSASADTDIEYTFRMFVAMGPWITSSRTGTASAPKVCTMITAGSAPVPVVAMEAPRTPSHNTGTNCPRAPAQNSRPRGTERGTKRE